MAVSYKRLWKLLIDRDMKKKDLAEIANISSYIINKLNRKNNVNTDTLAKICQSLGCTFMILWSLFLRKRHTSILLDNDFDRVKVKDFQD